jgi:hypothetical protein
VYVEPKLFFSLSGGKILQCSPYLCHLGGVETILVGSNLTILEAAMAEAEKAMAALAAAGAMTAMIDDDDDDDDEDDGYDDDGRQRWRRLPTQVPFDGAL